MHAKHSPSFIHLRTSSDYSIVRGLTKVKDLVVATTKSRMPALALADYGNLYGQVKFHLACLDQGVKPIAAIDFQVSTEDIAAEFYNLLLLARNNTGYQNLLQLVSDSHDTQQNDLPVLNEALLAKYSAGLIAISGGVEGKIEKSLLAGKEQIAKNSLAKYKQIFPNAFYIELQRIGRPREKECEGLVLQLAEQENIPVVATNHVCFLKEDDFEAHEVRVCVYEGYKINDSKRSQKYTKEQYLKTEAEMSKLFVDIPSALTNSVEIAKRCNMQLDVSSTHLPKFFNQEKQTEAKYLNTKAKDNLRFKLEQIFPDQVEREKHKDKYEQRLNFELQVIEEMGFAGYFLIVMEFINWAKGQNIPVGPGRGSGAGSLVSFVLDITTVDPLQFNLLFERFLNPERVSMPDIDIDFCVDNRDKVIQHVIARYGQKSVAQIATFGVMAARAAVRDVTRVLDKPYMLGDKLAKMIPFQPGVLLKDALEEAKLKEFIANDSDAATVTEMALKLEGVIRNFGKHAGGIVIAPGPLVHFVPLTRDSSSGVLVSQFDKDDIEKIGLVKFDFLGLRTLTIIDNTVQTINAKREQEGEALLKIKDLDLKDPQVYKLLKTGETSALFQLESQGMKSWLQKLKPDNFEEIVAMVALYRPGPLQSGMGDTFVNRKHGRERVTYPHPELQPILKATYGVILYQEQVMQIAQVLAGYSLGEADLLRRAMGKKNAKQMAQQKERFENGAIAHEVDAEKASKIFDLMEKFAGYGFNRSHSVAYAVVAYQTVWLKVFYPAEYMSAVMSADLQDTDRLRNFVRECRRLSVDILPPDVNKSAYKFTVDANGHIIYGLGAIKGLGSKVGEEIVNNRTSGYQDFFDFVSRVGTKVLSKRILEVLIKSGAMDLLLQSDKTKTGHRAAMEQMIADVLSNVSQTEKTHKLNVPDMFGDAIVTAKQDRQMQAEAVAEWSIGQRLENEMQALGLYLSGHPLDEYQQETKLIASHKIVDLTARRELVTLVGFIIRIEKKRRDNNEQLAFITIDDNSGVIDMMVSGLNLDKYQEQLVLNTILVVKGKVGMQEKNNTLQLRNPKIYTMLEACHKFTKGLILHISNKDTSAIDKLYAVLNKAKTSKKSQSCALQLAYKSANPEVGTVTLQPSNKWRVSPDKNLLHKLRSILGEDAVTWQQ